MAPPGGVCLVPGQRRPPPARSVRTVANGLRMTSGQRRRTTPPMTAEGPHERAPNASRPFALVVDDTAWRAHGRGGTITALTGLLVAVSALRVADDSPSQADQRATVLEEASPSRASAPDPSIPGRQSCRSLKPDVPVRHAGVLARRV